MSDSSVSELRYREYQQGVLRPSYLLKMGGTNSLELLEISKQTSHIVTDNDLNVVADRQSQIIQDTIDCK